MILLMKKTEKEEKSILFIERTRPRSAGSEEKSLSPRHRRSPASRMFVFLDSL